MTGWTSDSKVKGYSRSTRHRVEEQDVIEEGFLSPTVAVEEKVLVQGKRNKRGFPNT